MVSPELEVKIDSLSSNSIRRIFLAVGGMRNDPCEDERLELTRENWAREAFRLNPQQKDRVGHLFMQKILGLGRVTIKGFEENDESSFDEVSERLGNFVHPKNDTGVNRGAEFWQAVYESIPGFLDFDQTEMLKAADQSGVYALEMISIFDDLNPDSDTLRKLVFLS